MSILSSLFLFLRHSRLISTPRYRQPSPRPPSRVHLCLRLLLLLLATLLTAALLLQVAFFPGLTKVVSWAPYSAPILFLWATGSLFAHHLPTFRQRTTHQRVSCQLSQPKTISMGYFCYFWVNVIFRLKGKSGTCPFSSALSQSMLSHIITVSSYRNAFLSRYFKIL